MNIGQILSHKALTSTSDTGEQLETWIEHNGSHQLGILNRGVSCNYAFFSPLLEQRQLLKPSLTCALTFSKQESAFVQLPGCEQSIKHTSLSKPPSRSPADKRKRYFVLRYHLKHLSCSMAAFLIQDQV